MIYDLAGFYLLVLFRISSSFFSFSLALLLVLLSSCAFFHIGPFFSFSPASAISQQSLVPHNVCCFGVLCSVFIRAILLAGLISAWLLFFLCRCSSVYRLLCRSHNNSIRFFRWIPFLLTRCWSAQDSRWETTQPQHTSYHAHITFLHRAWIFAFPFDWTQHQVCCGI